MQELEDQITLPTVAVVYTEDSFSIFQLAEAARGICVLVWLIDSRIHQSPTSLKLMARLGSVVDIADLSLDAVADLITPMAPKGIATFADSGQLLAARIAERVGLDFHDVDTVERLIDKVAQRSALRAAGFPSPDFWSVEAKATDSIIDGLADAVSFPVVVKPRRGSASRDTYRAENSASLRKILRECRGEEMIVETFLSDSTSGADQHFANFVSVESVVIDGEVHHLAVTGRFPLAFPFRGSGMFIPSNLAPRLISEIQQLAGDAALALGVRSGFMHTEIKVTPEGPRIIEVNGRVGGGVPDILRLLEGPPLIAWRFRLAAGQSIPFDTVQDFDRIGFYLWHQPPIDAHEIVAIQGLDEVGDLAGVQEIRSKLQVGDLVDWRIGGYGHVFGVGGVVETYDELTKLRQQILTTARVEYR